MSITKILQRELCDKLVQSISLIIGHDVLITDKVGVVVASSDLTRVGTVHEASVQVINDGKMAYHDSRAVVKLAGTRPGMTIPFYVEDDVVGTIGITGAPQEVSRYVMLIQQMSEIFLDFRNQQQISARKTLKKQSLLRKIISFDNRMYPSSEIYEEAYNMEIDLNLSRIVVFIELLSKEGSNITIKESTFINKKIDEKFSGIFKNPQDFICPQNNVEYVAFICCDKENLQSDQGVIEKCKKFEVELQNLGYSIRMGIGSLADSIELLRNSYENACFASRLLEKEIRQGSSLAISDALLEKIAVYLPEHICTELESEFPDEIFKNEEVFLLIDHWCRSRFNFTQTAKEIHVHKSTLVYRFQRLQELYNLDLYDFDRICALYLLLIKKRLC
ncbi:CdaR family transcriptional regulator [Anaerotignum sp.]|nr:sugar diacid recognition domain-containing protein [Anaerotignum sp.]MBQ7758047.1 helix-turn-helix domain-containing protein [Anaerotignum sp.]